MPETALIIIGFQNARNDKKSDYYVGNLDSIVEKTNYLIAYAREMNYKIIFIRHIESEGDFALGNPNSEMIPELAFDKKLDTEILKYKISSFYNTKLESELHGIENVVVCGALSNLCVRMFVEEAYDRDFRIALLDDLTVAYSQDIHDETLEDLYATRAGISVLPLAKFVE